MSIADRYQAEVAAVASEAIGAHYLHGSFGNYPGVCNGHPAMNFRTSLAPNQYRQTAQTAIRIHAATTHVHTSIYCWGRPQQPAVLSLSEVPPEILRDPAALQQFVEREPRERYKWPRTNSGGNGAVHLGECCAGKRHFDCIGFVSWVIWRIFNTVTIRDIASCQRYARVQARNHPELAPGQVSYRAGDILIFNVNHIAFALNPRDTVEANGENFGVIQGRVRAGVTEVLRPTSELLHNIWNVPLT